MGRIWEKSALIPVGDWKMALAKLDCQLNGEGVA
jgi:hypothetical protein